MRVVLAGGGTTGHISPMLATAEALLGKVNRSDIVCVGTPRGLETSLVPQAGYGLAFVDPVPMPRQPSKELVTLPARLMRSCRQAIKIMKAHHASVVVGFGGYAALPAYLAARWLGLPLVIHEANAVPGLANRIGARFAASVCVTFPNTKLATGARHSHRFVTGMPVRQAVADLDRGATRLTARERFGFDSAAPVLLVSGGSQGARRLNEAVIAALPGLDEAGISVLHVTGKNNFDEKVKMPELTRSSYVRVAYVDRMEEAYATADLMLARSGSGTVTETAMVGLPVIYVPLPHGNGEQARNAAGVLAAGAGRLINDVDLTGERLVREATTLFDDPARLARMSQAARRLMPRDAARRVADHVMAAARGSHGETVEDEA